MMYSKHRPLPPASYHGQQSGADLEHGKKTKQTLFVFISFSPLISKLMVDSLMGANTQMYYLNGRIDYTGIVTRPRHTLILSASLLMIKLVKL